MRINPLDVKARHQSPPSMQVTLRVLKPDAAFPAWE